MKEQSEALSMADMLDDEALRWGTPELYKAAAKLRRLHAENETLRQQHLEAHRTAAALASAMTAISLRTHLGGEVAEYGDVVDAVRRLHAENERLHQINHAHEMKLSVRGYEIQIADLKAVNQELLEALKNLEKEFRRIYLIYYYAEPWGHETNVPLQAARAVIAKATGEKT
jgi:hypothetical protein